MSNKIITISREFGSGGTYIGILVAQKLGIPCYDKDIIEKIVLIPDGPNSMRMQIRLQQQALIDMVK